jgi:hypothetical protein
MSYETDAVHLALLPTLQTMDTGYDHAQDLRLWAKEHDPALFDVFPQLDVSRACDEARSAVVQARAPGTADYLERAMAENRYMDAKAANSALLMWVYTGGSGAAYRNARVISALDAYPKWVLNLLNRENMAGIPPAMFSINLEGLPAPGSVVDELPVKDGLFGKYWASTWLSWGYPDVDIRDGRVVNRGLVSIYIDRSNGRPLSKNDYYRIPNEFERKRIAREYGFFYYVPISVEAMNMKPFEYRKTLKSAGFHETDLPKSKAPPRSFGLKETRSGARITFVKDGQ